MNTPPAVASQSTSEDFLRALDTLACAGADDIQGADAGCTHGWPLAMQQEFRTCVTSTDRNAWALKWGRYLSGQAQREEREAALRKVMSERFFQNVGFNNTLK